MNNEVPENSGDSVRDIAHTNVTKEEAEHVLEILEAYQRGRDDEENNLEHLIYSVYDLCDRWLREIEAKGDE